MIENTKSTIAQTEIGSRGGGPVNKSRGASRPRARELRKRKSVVLPLARRLATDFDLIRATAMRSVPRWSRGFNCRARRTRFYAQGFFTPEKRSP